MMFLGEYIVKVNNSTIPVDYYSLGGEVCDIICAEEANGTRFVKVCRHGKDYINELAEFCKILSDYSCEIYDKLILPEEFLNYLDNSNAIVAGCGDCFEVLKEEDYKEQLKVEEIEGLFL